MWSHEKWLALMTTYFTDCLKMNAFCIIYLVSKPSNGSHLLPFKVKKEPFLFENDSMIRGLKKNIEQRIRVNCLELV